MQGNRKPLPMSIAGLLVQQIDPIKWAAGIAKRYGITGVGHAALITAHVATWADCRRQCREKLVPDAEGAITIIASVAHTERAHDVLRKAGVPRRRLVPCPVGCLHPAGELLANEIGAIWDHCLGEHVRAVGAVIVGRY
jgi:hypothetical protein